jgi:hypothetical protein
VNRFLLVMTIFALLVSLLLGGCNLGTALEAREGSLNATQTAQALPTPTQSEPDVVLVPLEETPGAIQLTPINLVPNDSSTCGRLRVDVGSDPGNTLRLREQPDNSATIILLIPNNTYVTRVAGSSDILADGYNWVNIQYTDPNGAQSVGWAARDAMRDRATLREEGC